jgi:transposase-like protein
VGVPALLRWRAADRATSYRLQVATSNTFSSGVVLDDSTITDTTKSVNGLSGKTTYYWRVSARNAAGVSVFTATRSFTTGLDTPVLSAPADGATGRVQPVLLSWAAVSGATGYHVQVSSESGFSSGLIVDDASVSSTSRSVSGLQASTLYYWRVAARDGNGDGSYATARTFTTSVASPTLVSPADNATNQPLTVTLQWSALGGATFYHVQVATDAGFASGVILDDATVTATSRSVTGLEQSTTYYWRVSAGNTGGEGPFSSARSFSTLFPAPALLSPAAGATGQPVSLTLQWGKVNGAVRYHLQLASDSLFTTFIKNDTTITDSVRLVNGLVNSTWYYWRVAAKSNTVTGPFSASRTFRTIGVLPAAVTLVGPAMDSKFKPDSVRCTWRRATGATRYWLEVGLDSLFQVRSVDSTLTDSTKVVHNLLLNAKVWWKVRAGTAEGWGPFSEVRRFTMDGPTGIQANNEIPGSYALQQNYPNPFNPSTMIAYDLPAAGTMRLEVFNMLGESVALLVDEYRTAGHHEARFNADGLSSGTYFYRMTAGGTVITRRMLLLR